jgi:phosphoglycolate phosphatase-like HAD superfamily hydrolase
MAVTSATMSQNLVIFDVDGTLVDAHPVDNDSFDQAFRKCTGAALTAEMWTTFEEVTAQAIVHQALGPDRLDLKEIEMLVRDLFLDGLRNHHQKKRDAIRLTPGAMTMWSSLRMKPEYRMAIATGCWRETAHFKIGVAGLDISGVPFACASDRYSRADIIALAAERAGLPVEQAVYVGDGVWDLKAARKLGIPFIGVGQRTDVLREAGARHVLDDWAELPAVLQQVFGRRS